MFKSTKCLLFFTRYSSPPKEYLISIFSTMLNLHSQSAYNNVDALVRKGGVKADWRVPGAKG